MMDHCQFFWINENNHLYKQVACLESQIFSDAWSEKAVLDTLRNTQGEILVATNEENVVGYVMIYHVLDECEIARIAVSPDYRRCKIGHRLMAELVSWCDEMDISRILLDVRESNNGAIAYYQEEGFLTDGVRKNFYDAPKENAVLMSKQVTKC